MRAVVRVSGYLSECFDVKQGVGQGTILSTFLFLVYVNDLNGLEISDYWSKIMSVSSDNPTCANDNSTHSNIFAFCIITIITT